MKFGNMGLGALGGIFRETDGTCTQHARGFSERNNRSLRAETREPKTSVYKLHRSGVCRPSAMYSQFPSTSVKNSTVLRVRFGKRREDTLQRHLDCAPSPAALHRPNPYAASGHSVKVQLPFSEPPRSISSVIFVTAGMSPNL